MEGEITNALKALSVNLWILRLAGIWIADIKKPALRLLYNIYGTGMILVMTVIYYLTEIIYLIMKWGDLEAMSEISFLLLTHIGTAVKLANLLIRRKRIENLVSDSCQNIFMPRNSKHRELLSKTISSANRDNVIFVLMCFSTVMAWAIVPLVENSQVRRLPLKIWLPFDTSPSPIFELIYAYQIFSVTMNAGMNAMMDTFASVLMALAGAQLDMLCHDLANLRKEDQGDIALSENVFRPLRRGGRSIEDEPESKLQTGSTLAKESSSSYQDDILHKRIVACIEHHRGIVRFAGEIEAVFGIGILVQFAVSSTILCLTCFQLSLISPMSLQFYSMLLYQGCMLFQIYCYCWHGNGIIVKTSELMTAAFQCQWTSCTPRFKNTLRIVMCRMQRPMRLMVGGLFSLSLETFSMILRTAYSFYAVLQRVHGGIDAEKRVN